MQCFDLVGARHFCTGPQRPTSATITSMRHIGPSLHGRRQYAETDIDFADLRTACLSDIDRLLFLGASQYRRGCELLNASSAHWALVTFYYASFYAAKALLGMFGVWIDERFVVMDVISARPGSQRLQIKKRTASSRAGSHQRFWDEYYQTTGSLRPWIDPTQHWILDPIRGDPDFLITSRNRVNYDPEAAISESVSLQASFSELSFPHCLSGDLGIQYRVADSLIALDFNLAGSFGLQTEGLSALLPDGRRSTKIRELILANIIPNLDGKILEAELLA
jgi:hypothetical protein